MIKRFRWILLALVPAGALLGLGAAAVVTYVMPTKYESTAVLQIPAIPDAPPVDMEAEMARLKRNDLLERVIDEQDLGTRWSLSKQEALEVIRKSLSVTRMDGQNSLIVRAEHPDRVDARDIAEELARGYQLARNKDTVRAKELAIGSMNKEVLDLQAAIEQGKEALGGYVGGLGKDGRDISEVKSKLDADQKLLDGMMKKRVELAATIPPEVTVLEKPVVSEVPCSPKVTENLVMGTAGGALLLPLLAGMVVAWLRPQSRG